MTPAVTDKLGYSNVLDVFPHVIAFCSHSSLLASSSGSGGRRVMMILSMRC